MHDWSSYYWFMIILGLITNLTSTVLLQLYFPRQSLIFLLFNGCIIALFCLVIARLIPWLGTTSNSLYIPLFYATLFWSLLIVAQQLLLGLLATKRLLVYPIVLNLLISIIVSVMVWALFTRNLRLIHQYQERHEHYQ